MLDLLRQLSAGSPSVVEHPAVPVAQGQDQGVQMQVFSLPHLDVFDELAEIELERFSAAETVHLPSEVIPVAVLESVARPALPVPDLAEQWLSGIRDQQALQVQAVNTPEPVRTVQTQGRAEYVPEIINDVEIVRRPVLPEVAPPVGVTRAPVAGVSQAVVPSPVTDVGTSLGLPPSLSESAVSFESVKTLVAETPALTPAAVTSRVAVSAGVEASEQALTEQLMQKIRQSVEVQLRQNMQSATIRLDPPELGSLEIFVSHESGRLQISIQAANADVSRLLLQTSERLRHDLVAANYLQVSVQVGSDGQPGRERRRSAYQQDPVLNAQISEEPQNVDRAPTDVLVTV